MFDKIQEYINSLTPNDFKGRLLMIYINQRETNGFLLPTRIHMIDDISKLKSIKLDQDDTFQSYMWTNI